MRSRTSLCSGAERGGSDFRTSVQDGLSPCETHRTSRLPRWISLTPSPRWALGGRGRSTHPRSCVTMCDYPTGKSVRQPRFPRQVIYFCFSEIFHFTPAPNQIYIHRCPVPFRGALAIVTNVGAGCGGRGSVGRAGGCRAG